MDSSEIHDLICATLREFRPPSLGNVIYGDGQMDSMGLVIFIAELEARIGEKTGKNIVLASELAMSQARSPFRDVSALTEFVQRLLRESTPK